MSDNASQPHSPTSLASTAKGSPVWLWDVGPMRYGNNHLIARTASGVNRDAVLRNNAETEVDEEASVRALVDEATAVATADLSNDDAEAGAGRFLEVPSKHASGNRSGRLSVSFGFDAETDDAHVERRSFLTRAMLGDCEEADFPDVFNHAATDDDDDVSSVSTASRMDDDDWGGDSGLGRSMSPQESPPSVLPHTNTQEELAMGSNNEHPVSDPDVALASAEPVVETAPPPPVSLKSMSSFYTRVMHSYRSALDGGNVVLERSALHMDDMPQSMQGDAAMYDEENLRKRHALQHTPETIALLQSVWDSVPKVSDIRRSPSSGHLTAVTPTTRQSRARSLSVSSNHPSPSATALQSPAASGTRTPGAEPALGASLLSRSGDAMGGSARESSIDGVITLNVFRAVSAYIFRRLVPAGTADDFLAHCASDWRTFAAPPSTAPASLPPAAGTTSKPPTPTPPPPTMKRTKSSLWLMNKNQFFKAMFSVVDVWTESCEADEYHDFMHRVLLKQAKKISDIDPMVFFDVRKNVFARGAFRKHRVRKPAGGKTPQRSPGGATSLPAKPLPSTLDLDDTTPLPQEWKVSIPESPSLSLNVFCVERSIGPDAHPVHSRAKDKLSLLFDQVFCKKSPASGRPRGNSTCVRDVFRRLSVSPSSGIARVVQVTPDGSDAPSAAPVHVNWTSMPPEATQCPLYDSGEAAPKRSAFNIEELSAALTIAPPEGGRASHHDLRKQPPSVLIVADYLLMGGAVSQDATIPLPILTQRDGSRTIVSSTSRIDDAMELLVEQVAHHVPKDEMSPELPPEDDERNHLSLVHMPIIASTLEIPTMPSPQPPLVVHRRDVTEPMVKVKRAAESVGDSPATLEERQSIRRKESIVLGFTPTDSVSVAISTTAIGHHSLKGRKFVRSKHLSDQAPLLLSGNHAPPTLDGRSHTPSSTGKRRPSPSHHSTRGPRPPTHRYHVVPSALVAKRKHFRQECGEVIAHDILAEGLVKRRADERLQALQRRLADPDNGVASEMAPPGSPRESSARISNSSARTQTGSANSSLPPQEQLVSTTAARNPRLGAAPQGVRGTLPPGALKVVRTIVPRIVPDTKAGKVVVVVPEPNPHHKHRHHKGAIPPAARGAGRHPVQLVIYEPYDRPYLDRLLSRPEDDTHAPSALREQWRAPPNLAGETLEGILCNDAHKYPRSVTALARAALQEYESAVEQGDNEVKRSLKKALPSHMHRLLKHVVSQHPIDEDSSSTAGGRFDEGMGRESLAMQIAGLASQDNPNLLLLALLSARQREELDARDCNRQRARSLGHLEVPALITSGPSSTRLIPENKPYRGIKQADEVGESSIPQLPPIPSASPRHIRGEDGGTVVVVRSPTARALSPPQLQINAHQGPDISSASATSRSVVATGAHSRQIKGDSCTLSWDEQLTSLAFASHFSPALTRGHLSAAPGRHTNSVLEKYNDHQSSVHKWSSKVSEGLRSGDATPSLRETVLPEVAAPDICGLPTPFPQTCGRGLVPPDGSVLDRPDHFGARRGIAGGGGNATLALQRRLERHDPTLDPSIQTAAYSRQNMLLLHEIDCAEETRQKAKVETVLAAVENVRGHSRLREHAAQAGRTM